MSYADLPYQELLAKLVELSNTCEVRPDRTGTGVVSIFGHQMRFDLSKGFPLLTTKKVHFPSIVSELLWFLKGDTNIKYLLGHTNHIWTDWRLKEYNEWASKSHITREYRPVYTHKEFEQRILEDAKFAEEWGDIGKGYGHQWRNFGEVQNYRDQGIADSFSPKNHKFVKGFDQISWVLNEIKTNPCSRRLIVSGWNPHEVDKVDLPPCHTLHQYFVEPMTLDEREQWLNEHYVGGSIQAVADAHRAKLGDETFTSVEYEAVLDFAKAPTHKLSCQLYQRSADVFLGLPFNIASYALLTHIIAKECGLAVGDFVWTGGDTHLYTNHVDQAIQQLANSPYTYQAPKVVVADKNIFELEPSDIELVDYESYPTIKAPVAV